MTEVNKDSMYGLIKELINRDESERNGSRPMVKIASFIYGTRGMGHRVRCQAIADALEEKGWQIAMGYVPNKVDIVIVDSKEPFDTSILSNKKVILIDTTRNDISAELIIFPHPWPPDDSEERELVYGPEYIVINPVMEKVRTRAGTLRDLVVVCGGRDPKKIMLRVIELLTEMNYAQPVNAMYGKCFSPQQLSALIGGPRPLKMHANHFQPSLFKSAKASICTFGLTFYEMLYLHIPTLVLTHSKSDEIILRDKYISGVMLGGMGEKIGKTTLQNFLEYVETNPLVDDLGIDGNGCRRIANKIEEIASCTPLRPGTF